MTEEQYQALRGHVCAMLKEAAYAMRPHAAIGESVQYTLVDTAMYSFAGAFRNAVELCVNDWIADGQGEGACKARLEGMRARPEPAPDPRLACLAELRTQVKAAHGKVFCNDCAGAYGQVLAMIDAMVKTLKENT